MRRGALVGAARARNMPHVEVCIIKSRCASAHALAQRGNRGDPDPLVPDGRRKIEKYCSTPAYYSRSNAKKQQILYH